MKKRWNDKLICFGNKLCFFTWVMSYRGLNTMICSITWNWRHYSLKESASPVYLSQLVDICLSPSSCLVFPLATVTITVTGLARIGFKMLFFLAKSNHGGPWLTIRVDMCQVCSRISLVIIGHSVSGPEYRFILIGQYLLPNICTTTSAFKYNNLENVLYTRKILGDSILATPLS